MVICIFGDSIAWGAFDHKKGGWANRLKKNLEEQDKNIKLLNLSVSGNTSQDVIVRFENEVKDKNADVIIFAIGINDRDTDYSVFEKNIKKLHELGCKYSKKIMFVGLTRVDKKRINILARLVGKKYENKKIDKRDEIIESICKQKKIKYIAVKNELSKNDLIDGLHPNTVGHEKMFNVIKSAVVTSI